VNADNGSCLATNVALGSATTADNCGVASVTNNAPASFPVGSTTVIWTVTDVNGRTATATQVVTVTDNQNPVISNTPSDITVYTGAGSTTCNKVVTWTAPTASDNCSVSTLTSTHTSGAVFPVGTTTVTYTATDVNGNTATSSFTVAVIDNTNPVVNVQNITLNLTSAGTGTITAAQINNGSTDNCGIASIVLNKTNFTCSDLGSQTVTLTVTDIHGNSASANATVLVKDVTAPTVLTKNITVNLDASGNASITAAQVDNGSSDVCGPVTLSVSQSTFNCSNVSLLAPTDLIISEYVEGGGNNKYIEIFNGTNTSINLSGYQLSLYTNGSSSPTSAGTLTGTIAPGGTAVFRNSSATTVIGTSLTNLTFNGNDAVALRKSTGEFVDIIGRIGNDPDPSNNNGTGWILGGIQTQDRTLRRKPTVVKGVTVSPTGTGPGAFTTLTTEWDVFNMDAVSGLGSHTINSNSNTVTLTVTDGSGNQSIGTAYVTVLDVTAPVVITKNITVNLNASGTATISPTDIDNGSSDACGIATRTIDISNFNCSNITSPVTVTLTVTDVNGNTASNTALVTVKDVTPPTVVTKNITVQLDGNGSATITPAQVDNGSSDACGPVTLQSVSPSLFSCNNIIRPTELFISEYVEGGSNNKAIEIYNGTANVIDLNSAGYNLQVYTNGSTSPFATINLIGIIQPGKSFVIANPAANSSILLIANQTSGSLIFNGDDAVVLRKGTSNIDIFGRIGEDPGTEWSVGGVTTEDNTILRRTYVTQGVTVNPTSGFPTLATQWQQFAIDNITDLGKHKINGVLQTVTLTVKDASGNSSTGTATVLVEDNIAPNVITQNITVQLDASGNASITAAQIDNGSTDACGILSYSLDKTSFTCANVGPNTVTLTVTDVNGNVATKTAVVTVEDKVAPNVITQNITVQLDASGNASITAAQIDNGSTDACGILSYSLDKTSFTCANVGPNTVTLTVTDVNGNIATKTAVVTVEDKVAPNVITQNITVQLDASGNASITAAQIDNGSTDACGIATRVLDVTSFTCSNVGPNTVTLTVTDVNGNVATKTAVVTVEDKVAPNVITQNITVQLDASGNASITPAQIDNGSTDACGILSYSLDKTSFTCANVGANTVTLTVTDVNGNVATKTAVVTVKDEIAPSVITQNITVQLDASGNASITPAQIDNGSTDACGIATRVLDVTSFDCANVGPNTVTLTVTDVNGNSSTATATVTVVDNITPTAVAQNVTIYLNASGTASTTAAAVNNGSSDNCGVATLALSKTDFNCSNVGDNTVTLTVTDVNGNSSTATAIVTVVDNIAPTAVAQNVTIYLNASGTASTTAEAVNNGSSDNCGVATLALSKTSFDCSNVGDNSVTLTVTDVNGNSSTATAIVTVKDEVAPVAKCQNIAVYLGQSGTVSITASQINNGSTDACGIASISISQTLFTAAGTYPVILTVTDVNGNSSTCSATVTVNKRPVTLVYNGDNSEQYSDQQMLSATLTDVLSGTPLSGKTITFTIGTQSVTAVTNASGIASATLILTQNPDLTTYTVKTVFNGDATYVAGNDEDAFDITDEDARAEYIGTQFQATASATSGTATVQLQASILDITAVTGNPATDAYAGTITNARVKFVLYNGSTFTDISGWLTPALINSSDSKVGVVSFDWPVNIGTADAAQYNVGIVIDNGYYIGEAPVNTITVVTVYKPLGDFVTGGGYIIPTQSGGTYAATPGLKMNFGLNVKYNKKGTNLQGGVNMIFRRNVGGVIRTYQIKSNSMTSLGTSGTSTPVVDRYAEFLSKANLTDVTNPLAPVALGGNLDLRVSMRDRGEPGSTDEIAVTLFSGTGSLLFSSKWTGSSTQRMVLTGGNIVVRGDNYGAAPAVKLAGPSPTTNSITDNFNVKVLGNPSLATFRLQLQSSDKQQKITVKIVDVNGRIVEVKENLYAGQVIEVGAKYTQGTYFAEVMQGTNRKVVKLLKIARD
jgi:hypothetical protein